MTTTPQPITPEFFLQAIRDLELEQLHAETTRLQLSLYHLRRSQVALEEFRDDPVCKSAIEDNEVVIRNQVDRIDLIRLEIERRGFSMEHGAEIKDKLVNGSTDAGPEESLGQEVVMGGTVGGDDDGMRLSEDAAANTATRRSGEEGYRSGGRDEGGDEGEGVYL